jgi:hypothetical protein
VSKIGLFFFSFPESEIEIAAKSILASGVTKLSDTTGDMTVEKVVGLMSTTLAVASRPNIRMNLKLMYEHESIFDAPFSELRALTVCDGEVFSVSTLA